MNTISDPSLIVIAIILVVLLVALASAGGAETPVPTFTIAATPPEASNKFANTLILILLAFVLAVGYLILTT